MIALTDLLDEVRTALAVAPLDVAKRDKLAEEGARVRFLSGDERRAYIAGFHDGALADIRDHKKPTPIPCKGCEICVGEIDDCGCVIGHDHECDTTPDDRG